MKQAFPSDLRNGAASELKPRATGDGAEPTAAEFAERLQPIPVPPAMSTSPQQVVKTDTAASWKTTLASIIAAVGLVIEQIQRDGIPDDLMGWLGLLFKASIALVGWFARDKDVTSEGHKVVTPNEAT